MWRMDSVTCFEEPVLAVVTGSGISVTVELVNEQCLTEKFFTVKFDGAVGFSEGVLGDALVRAEIIPADLADLEAHVHPIGIVR